MMTKILKYIYHSFCSHPYIFCILGLLLFYSDVAFAVTDEYKNTCHSDIITKEYDDAGCWSCDIILVLLLSMTDAITAISKSILDLSKIIITLGAAIWYAVYFLKSLGSMAAQDPVKIIDGALIFGFKIGFVYAVVNSGIDTIVGYIVNPLLSIGVEIGTEFSRFSGIGV